MLNYLAKATSIGVYIVVHQCARISTEPKLPYEKSIKRVVKCVDGTKDVVIKVRINSSKGIEVYAASDFVSIWNK